MADPLHAEPGQRSRRSSMASSTAGTVSASSESEREDEGFEPIERTRSQSLPTTKRGRGRPRINVRRGSHPGSTPKTPKRKAHLVSPIEGFNLKKWCTNTEGAGKGPAVGVSGSNKETEKGIGGGGPTAEMEEGDLSSMSMDDKMMLLIREMRINREMQDRQYKKLSDRWRGLEDKAEKMGSELKKLKRVRVADKTEIESNTTKVRETNAKLAEQEKKIVALEESVKRLAEKVDRDGRRPKGAERNEGAEGKTAGGQNQGEGFMEERKWEEWERERIRNNIVISGLKLPGRPGREELENWFESNLGEKVKPRKVWVIRGRNEKIGIECEDRRDKERIMRKKATLRGGDVFIDHDTTYKVRRNKEIVRAHAREVREKGAEVKVGYNKVWIDGAEHRYDEWKGRFFLWKNGPERRQA